MGIRYLLSSLTPLLLVFLIVSILSFSITFIASFSDAIDRMIVILGSGSILTQSEVDTKDLPEGSSVDYVKTGEGILYGENGESLVYLKGFDTGYFDGERGEKIKLYSDPDIKGNTIYISSSLSRLMDLDILDRMTLLLYEKDKDRTRPVLMTVKGIFDSGYAQLDKYLAYVDNSLLSGDGAYEVLLPAGCDIEGIQDALMEKGIWSESYREIYSALYTNVQSSIQILYIILAAVALLSAFFSSDVARVYVDRDKSDIAALLMLGLPGARVRMLYSKMTLIASSIASIAGIIVGIAISYATPALIRGLSRYNPSLFEYYITGFDITIPYSTLLVMFAMMLLFSFATLYLSLKRVGRDDLSSLVENE